MRQHNAQKKGLVTSPHQSQASQRWLIAPNHLSSTNRVIPLLRLTSHVGCVPLHLLKCLRLCACGPPFLLLGPAPGTTGSCPEAALADRLCWQSLRGKQSPCRTEEFSCVASLSTASSASFSASSRRPLLTAFLTSRLSVFASVVKRQLTRNPSGLFQQLQYCLSG